MSERVTDLVAGYDAGHAERGGVFGELASIVREVIAARGLIVQLTWRDIRVRYKQAVMGFAWAILSPMLIVAAGVVVRTALVRMADQPLAATGIAAVVIKGLAWGFFAGAIGFATTSLTGNAHLISKVYFTREALPISVILASAFDSLIGSAAFALFLPLLGWTPSLAVLWAPLLIVLLLLFTLTVGLLVSCGNLFFRDIKYIMQALITFGIFFTPVFFEPAILGAKWVRWQMLNPLAPLLEGLRLSVVEGHNLARVLVGPEGAVVWTPMYLGYSTLWATVGLAVAALIFHRSQGRFAEYV